MVQQHMVLCITIVTDGRAVKQKNTQSHQTYGKVSVGILHEFGSGDTKSYKEYGYHKTIESSVKCSKRVYEGLPPL